MLDLGGNKRRRKSKSAVVYIPVAAILISTLVLLGIGVFLRVIEIEVTGASRHTIDDIIKASGIKAGDNMLFIDKVGAVKSIQSAMPYISGVNIETKLPDKIIIEVNESVPLAMLEDQAGIIVVDSSGRILDITEIAPKGLIEIRGFTPVNSVVGNVLRADVRDETRLRCLLEVIEAINNEGIESDVSFIDVSNIVYINFRYSERFLVMLGTTDNIAYKMGTLSEAVNSINATRPKDETGTIYLSDKEPGRWSPDR